MLIKIEKITSQKSDLILVSANEILKYDIPSNNGGIEITLADNSILLLENNKIYYTLNINAFVYDIDKVIFINDEILDHYHKINEDVVGYKYNNKDIKEVDEYQIDKYKIIRLRF